MDIVQPHNTKVLTYLSRGKKDAPVFALPNSARDPYYECGCHPDVVERVWDQIGKALPKDCRCLIHGTPALAHPKSGIILATAIGTQYGLRLPGDLGEAAIKAGAKLCVNWTGGGSLDIRRELGQDWVFGSWSPNELIWCKSVYAMFDSVQWMDS